MPLRRIQKWLRQDPIYQGKKTESNIDAKKHSKKFDLQRPYYQNRKTVLLNLPIVVEILLKGGLCCSVTWADITQRNYNYTRLSQDGFRLPAHPPPFLGV